MNRMPLEVSMFSEVRKGFTQTRDRKTSEGRA